MKFYYQIIGLVLGLVAWVGFIGPYCISSNSNELIIGYILLSILIAIPALAVYIIKSGKKILNKIPLIILCLFAIQQIGCSKVPAGNVGVKVYLLGQSKGVDNEVLPVGRYWIGINEELYLYPTYQINYVFTSSTDEGSLNNEEFAFQTVEGMECTVDLGVAIRFDEKKVSRMFQTYRKGPEEIRGVVVRNVIRDALNMYAGTMPIESVYGSGKSDLMKNVLKITKEKLDSTGIIVDGISLIGSIRIPASIKKALDEKVAATQRAQQRENELREAEAAAKKAIATAEGEAQSNQIKASSLSSEIIEWQRVQNEKAAIEKWNGVLPQVTSGATPLLNLK